MFASAKCLYEVDVITKGFPTCVRGWLEIPHEGDNPLTQYHLLQKHNMDWPVLGISF
jgi:hypothetical protein